MSSCAIWFTHKKEEYRLPVNPEEITETSVMAIEKYDVLKLGQIAVPGSMKLREFSFEAEFPREVNHYVEETDNFRTPDFWLQLFKGWRDNREPVLFTSAYSRNYVSKGVVTTADAEDISTYVLIEELTITDKAGEEGDKYINFKLLEYREFGKKTAYIVENEILPFSIKSITEEVTPKSNGYHIVASGETLWAIAKKYYGDGSKYNIIFNANKDKIKNPALIHVGWKLKIPDKSEFAKYNAPLPKTVQKEPELPTYQGGVSEAGRSHSSGGRKIVIYQGGYNAQGLRGGVSEGGRTHSSGGRSLGAGQGAGAGGGGVGGF